MPKTFRSRKSPLKILCVLVLLGLVASTAYFYVQYQDASENDGSDAERIIEKVEKLATLPDEEPAVTELDDTQELSGQEFFIDSRDDDWLLVYPSTNQAIIYREETNKIINIGPVAFGTASTESTTTTTTVPATTVATVAIVAENNDSNNTTNRLNTDFAGRLTVEQVASSAPITSTVIVVNNEAFAALAQEIAPIVEGTIGTTPAGQSGAEADIVIYLAN